jgi:CubicO group peptidase (beta-lactamase class C family)
MSDKGISMKKLRDSSWIALDNIPILILILFVTVACEPWNNSTTDNEWLENQKVFLEKNKEFKSKFENRIKNIFLDKQLAGDFLFAIVNEHGLAYSYALNREIINNNSTTLNNDSPIYLASHTKSFTGTLLKILEEEGIIDLNKSINHYLPELTLKDSVDTGQIKVRQLLNHTHGINSTLLTGKTAFLGYSGDNRELINDLNNDYKYDSSNRFRYSNTGPIIAAMIVERVTGNSWKAEMMERIFTPLEMRNTSCNVSDFKHDDIRPAVTVSQDGSIFQSGFYKKDITMHVAGGTISTINDLTKWLQANINRDPVLLKSETSWNEMHKPATAQDRRFFTYNRFGYSLGWDLADYLNDTLLTRFGSYAGIMFHISFLPSKKLGVIAFSSDSRVSYLTHLAANYAYNIITHNPEAENVYKSEKELFDNSFDKNSNRELPAEEDKLVASPDNDMLIGDYKNNSGWPDIIITKNDSAYFMSWGVLNGPVYKIPNPPQPYIGLLGAMGRTFNVKEDSLLTGSLIYIRQN